MQLQAPPVQALTVGECINRIAFVLCNALLKVKWLRGCEGRLVSVRSDADRCNVEAGIGGQTGGQSGDQVGCCCCFLVLQCVIASSMRFAEPALFCVVQDWFRD